jgi:phosphatidylglycerophosphate synthase
MRTVDESARQDLLFTVWLASPLLHSSRLMEGQPMAPEQTSLERWQTKSSDRFVLKWIKRNLSARITPRLLGFSWLRPWLITVCGAGFGIAAGAAFAMGWGVVGGLLTGISQILDGVDGQFARLTGKQSPSGAFLDSVLDRYSDGFMVLGLIIFNINLGFPGWLLFILGAFAFIGSGLVSYSSARAENLGIDLGNPTLASKGTRCTVIAIAGTCSGLFPCAPMLALCYLVLHPNTTVGYRIWVAFRQPRRVVPRPAPTDEVR